MDGMMLLFLFVFIHQLRSEGLDLQEIINSHPAHVNKIALDSGTYTAVQIKLLQRNITFARKSGAVSIDAHDQKLHSFELEHSHINLVQIAIVPTDLTFFLKAQANSSATFDQCTLKSSHFLYPLMFGRDSSLLLLNMTIAHTTFSASILEGDSTADDQKLSINCTLCTFSNITVALQKPVLGGVDVQDVTIRNSTFSSFACTDEGQLPSEPITGVPNRSVDTNITNSTNAVRFSANVAFSGTSHVNFTQVTANDTTTARPWTNGSVLFVPNSDSHVELTNCSFVNCRANQSGGCVYLSTSHAFLARDVVAWESFAGQDGGCICLNGDGSNITLDGLHVRDSVAERSGGAVHATGYSSFALQRAHFERCTAKAGFGGALLLHSAVVASFSVQKARFANNTAPDENGSDIAVWNAGSAVDVVKGHSFKECESDSAFPRVTLLPAMKHTWWTDSSWSAHDIFAFCTSIGVPFVVVCVVAGITACCILLVRVSKKRVSNIRHENMMSQQAINTEQQLVYYGAPIPTHPFASFPPDGTSHPPTSTIFTPARIRV